MNAGINLDNNGFAQPFKEFVHSLVILTLNDDRTNFLYCVTKLGGIMKQKTKMIISIALGTIFLFIGSLHAQRFMEKLDRGVVAVRTSDNTVFISWRMFGTDPPDIGFNVYCGLTKITSSPITNCTNYIDSTSVDSTYRIRPIHNGNEWMISAPVSVLNQNYLSIPIQIPEGGTSPDDVSYTYNANDCSVGDLDGDGEYEIILKWDPSNSHDNAHDGYTGNVFLDAYKLDGTLMWRIDLGINIRAGAHYTQFMVYDLDSDGKAEVSCKTADGTIDGTGVVIGDENADYRSSVGRILSGPEFLTIFDGQTGATLVTTDYIVPRGNILDWGDDYGNRVDRFLACIAYLDGEKPSLVMCRGYYTARDGVTGRTVLAAWDWRDGALTSRWVFGANPTTNSDYLGQGNHNLSVGDVDDDGKDEIIYGACAIDDDGTGLYTTGLGHGDAIHLSDMDPDHPGLEVFDIHESPDLYGPNGGEFRAAGTGQVIYGIDGHNNDVGRGCALDIDPRYFGYEAWTSSDDYIYSAQGNPIYERGNAFYNFGVWWDGDLLREMLDATTIAKWRWDYSTPGRKNLLYSPPGAASNNGTKKTPCLSGDIIGDWREEVIWRSSDNQELRIYSTTIPTSNRIYTLMHDPQYRLAIAWQNVAYNQPPHPGFYLGDSMDTPPTPNIKYAGGYSPSDEKEVHEQLPKEHVLEQNYPNPFNSFTTIRYHITQKTHVQIIIYNLLGKEIKTLVDSDKQNGIYEINWNGKDNWGEDISSGIYFYQLKTDGFSLTRKLCIIR